MRTTAHVVGVLFGLVAVVVLSCSAGDAAMAAGGKTVETVLLETASVQHGAYAELLNMFSAEGTAPLLSPQVDLGAEDSKTALVNYRRLIAVTDRLAGAEREFREAIQTLSDQTGLPAAGPAAPRNAVGWSQRLFALRSVSQASLLQSDLLHAGWKFWKYAENARRTARATVLGVAFADADVHRLEKPELEMMRGRVFEVARTRYADQGVIGNSEREFFENLRDGKLDHIAQRLHADMAQDGSLEGLAYMTVAGMQGKRPIDVVYEEGCRGLAAGVDLYVAAGKAVVAGGLDGEAGEKFLEGFDKAGEIVEKIQELESQAEELGNAVRDPIGYMQEKVPQVLQERAMELLKEKTGLSDEVIEECTDQLGEAVQQVVQHVEVSRRIDEAYARDRFLSELATEKSEQRERRDTTPRDTTLRETAADGARLRRITDQVCEEMADEGWNLAAVAIDFRAAADATSGAARSSLDSRVAWWNDASATRLTILPTPVAPGTTICLPGGARVELIELADSGAIRRLTQRPVAVPAQGIAQVAVRPQTMEVSSEAVAVRPERPAARGDQLPTVQPRTPPRVAVWPNPDVFLPPGLLNLTVPGDRCLIQAHPPRPMEDREAPEWQGASAAHQMIYRMGGLPIFRTAHIYIRPLASATRPDAGSSFRFRGVEWGPMQPLSADQSILFTQRNGIGIAVVSAGGYLAVVCEITSREDAEVLRAARLEFLRTIRDRLNQAGGQD